MTFLGLGLRPEDGAAYGRRVDEEDGLRAKGCGGNGAAGKPRTDGRCRVVTGLGRNGPSDEVNPATGEPASVDGSGAKLGRSEVSFADSTVRIGVRQRGVEAPHVEVFDAVASIRVVQCRTLAERTCQQPTGVPTRRARCPAEQVAFVDGCQVRESGEVAIREPLVGAVGVGHWWTV